MGVFTSQAQPISKKGIIDLRANDFIANPTIKLDGEWEFYWNKLYSTENLEQRGIQKTADFIDYTTRWGDLPQLQNSYHQFGYATMRLKVLVDEDLPPLSVYLPEVFSAYDLYVNGEGFEGNGKVSKDQSKAKPYWRPSVKRINLKPGENVLVLHLMNYWHHKGGAIEPIQIGASDEINFARNFRNSSTLFLAGCLLIAGALAFGFYWFNTTDYTGLYLFLFSCTYMYRILGTEEYVIHAVNRNIPWSVTLRLEYISLYLSIAFFICFIRNLIEPKVKVLVLQILAGINIALAVFTLFLPTAVFTSFIDYYLVFLGIGMISVGSVYLLKINLSHKTSFVTLAGGVFIALVACVKILSHFHMIEDSEFLASIGYVGFIFSQAIAMTIRFGRNYRESTIAAQAAARSKDQFLNTMSHELRTPMSAILGMADLLENSRLNSDQKEKVSTIKKSGESLLTIIKDILSITEAGTGKIQLENGPLSIKECLKSAYALVGDFQKPSVQFISYLDPEMPDLVVGDITKVKQVLTHLLSNAFKFTNSGTVELKARKTKTTDQNIEIAFEVIDTGIGMKKSTLGKIFSAFSQEESGNDRKFGGLGLGLALVKQIVEQMKGEVKVDSSFGDGTKISFNLVFDVYEAIEIEEASTKKVNSINKELKVLYAEDNPVNQKLIGMMMKSFGVDIDIAVNGYEAWEMAKERAYDIILMDIQMPEMDGIEATKRIILDVDQRPVVIAITANATISDKKRCFEAGMNDFLTKPIKPNVLKDGILKWQNFHDNMDNNKPSGKYIQMSS